MGCAWLAIRSTARRANGNCTTVASEVCLAQTRSSPTRLRSCAKDLRATLAARLMRLSLLVSAARRRHRQAAAHIMGPTDVEELATDITRKVGVLIATGKNELPDCSEQ